MNSADTADQMMKMTLEGIQVAAEVGLKQVAWQQDLWLSLYTLF